jgi:hypothetical protein
LNRFFMDPNAEYALKKSLIVEVESFLETVFVADELACVRPDPVVLVPLCTLEQRVMDVVCELEEGRKLAVKIWEHARAGRTPGRDGLISSARQIAGSILRFVAIPLIKGCSWSGPRSRPYFKVASDNKWVPNQYLGARDDLFLVDGKRFKKEDVLIVFNPRQPEAPESRYRAEGVATIDPACLPVPLKFWLTDFMPRVLRFIGSAVPLSFSEPLSTVFLRLALQVIRSSVDFEILLQHVRIGTLTSIVEYATSHIVRTLVLNRYGGRTLRLPHSQLDCPGVVSAYLHYDLFCSSGGYLPAAWGESWSPRTRREAVGLMFNEGNGAAPQSEAAEGAEQLIKTLEREGRRLLTVFTGSNTGWDLAEEMDWQTLAFVLKLCRQRDDLVVVIKPKFSHESFLEAPRFRALLDPYRGTGRVHFLHRRWGMECTSTYALKHSVACVAAHGSVVAEALAEGVPVFVPPFPEHKTPWVEQLLGTVFFESFQDFEAALEASVDGALPRSADLQLMRKWFDPYCDGRAIERMKELVLALNDPHRSRT